MWRSPFVAGACRKLLRRSVSSAAVRACQDATKQPVGRVVAASKVGGAVTATEAGGSERLLKRSDWRSNAHWLNPGDPDNPYPVKVLDVSPFTQTRVANCPDARVRQQFVDTRTPQPNTERKRPGGAVELIPRDVVGHDLVYYLPFVEGRMSVPLDRMVAEMNTKVGPVRLARTMEEKWDLYQVRTVWVGAPVEHAT